MSLSGLQTNISTRPQDPTNANRDASSRSKKFGTLTRKYDKEKERRERSDGVEQYVELEESTRFAYLAEDPFVDHESMNAQPSPLQDGQEVKVIILGAGFAGLLFAARLIEAGTSPDDIRLVDIAGGFGGTWYWNRYPGIMCDTEASVYCPLLEETGYMPKTKYAHGEELRHHADRIARHFGFEKHGVFRTKVISAEWNDDTRRWALKMEQHRGPRENPAYFTACSQFFLLANGFLNHPKAPIMPGLGDFQGKIFHTARWDYTVTNGSQEDPTLSGLEGKKVGIIGTGATAVQAVPVLARFAKELYVFQRTPISVGFRGQQVTDPVEWKTQIAAEPGWQVKRMTNFELLSQGEPADDRFLTDGWTKLKTFAVFTGQSTVPAMTNDRVQEHIEHWVELDVPFQDKIRQRVEEVVHNRQTAEALKPWYPTWCKRPGFHDEYLDTFNLPNVHLVDTADTKGISRASAHSVFAGEKEIELDVLILSTGFRPFGTSRNPDPGAKSNTTITGRDSLTMAQKWAEKGAVTLHGTLTSSFPNLFIGSSGTQCATNPNVTGGLDNIARYTAYIITESFRRVLDPDRLAIEPSIDAEEAWAAESVTYARWSSPIAVCTPGYFNGEGEALKAPETEEEELKKLRSAPYMRGLPAFRKILADWKANGRMDGIILRS